MKRNKSGISLIVLVITVIVMIILAGSVIISLSNSGIIGKANEAVDANNLKQVQQLAALAWSEAYIDKMTDPSINLKEEVEEALLSNKIDLSKYALTVTDNGVSVHNKSTLGSLITDPTLDYGKLVNYKANGVTEWQVFYETDDYVFLIAKNGVGEPISLPEGYNLDITLTTEQTNLYNIFKLGQAGYTLTNDTNSNCVKWLISNTDFSSYANTAMYGNYVVGAIGGPTIELLAAGYNAKYPTATTKINPIVDLTYGEITNEEFGPTGQYGYFINEKGTGEVRGLAQDGLYFLSGTYYWLTSPSAVVEEVPDYGVLYAYSGGVGNNYYYGICSIRPVVCLSSNIPAFETANGYSLVE